jgi:hypothetical protein
LGFRRTREQTCGKPPAYRSTGASRDARPLNTFAAIAVVNTSCLAREYAAIAASAGRFRAAICSRALPSQNCGLTGAARVYNIILTV